MPDTGAPWNIPYVASSDLVRDWPTDNQTQAEAVADALDAAAVFDTVTTITATDASWTVPTLLNPVVRVTVIGSGGGGGGWDTNASNGNSSSFACSAGTATASGGLGGFDGATNFEGRVPGDGFVSNNGGMAGNNSSTNNQGGDGTGGAITVAYLDLTGVTTANVTVGAGGAGGDSGGDADGSAGGDGVVIVEYRAG